MPLDLLQFQREFAVSLDRPANGAMAVYRNTVLHGAVEALRANYPVVEQIVGTEMFQGVAVDFATECPPLRPALTLYGARFAEWLEGQPWIGDLDYLPDVARVERLRVESLHGGGCRAAHRRRGEGAHGGRTRAARFIPLFASTGCKPRQ